MSDKNTNNSKEHNSNEPDSNEPDSNEPDSNEPDSNEPDSNEPDSNEPDSNEPKFNSEIVDIFNHLKSGEKCIVPRQAWKGRGIVICGGGHRLFANATVTIKMLRHWGCTLPIEWFYADTGEMTADTVDYLQTQYGVKCFNTDLIQQFKGFDKRGFQIKPIALLLSSFEEIIFVDSDNLPLIDPEVLFDTDEYKENGAIFWKDYWQYGINDNHDHAGVRQLHQMLNMPEPTHGEFEFESGQMVINKVRHYRALQVVLFMALNKDVFYRLVYGDKDTYRIAWKFCEAPFHVVDAKPGVIGFLNKDEKTFKGFGMIQAHPYNFPMWIHMTVHSWEEKKKPWNTMVTEYNNIVVTRDQMECFILCYDQQVKVMPLTEKMRHTMILGELFWKEIIVWENKMLVELQEHDNEYKEARERDIETEKSNKTSDNDPDKGIMVKFPQKKIINDVVLPKNRDSDKKITVNKEPLCHIGTMENNTENSSKSQQELESEENRKRSQNNNQSKPIELKSI